MKKLGLLTCLLSFAFAGNTSAGTTIIGADVTLSYTVGGQVRYVNTEQLPTIMVDKIGGIRLKDYNWNASPADNEIVAGLQAEYIYSVANSGNFTETISATVENKAGSFSTGGWLTSLAPTSVAISREGVVGNLKLFVTPVAAANDQDTGSFALKIAGGQEGIVYGRYQGNNQNYYGANKNILETISFIVKAPSMSITKKVTIQAPVGYTQLGGSANTPVPGAVLTYTLIYENTGSYKATNVEITDLVPANTEFMQAIGGTLQSYKHGDGWDSDYSPVTPVDPSVTAVKWVLGEVAAGGKGEVVFKVVIK